MLPPVPPVGFQLMRDPNTGQLLFLPTTTTIGKFHKLEHPPKKIKSVTKHLNFLVAFLRRCLKCI